MITEVGISRLAAFFKRALVGERGGTWVGVGLGGRAWPLGRRRSPRTSRRPRTRCSGRRCRSRSGHGRQEGGPGMVTNAGKVRVRYKVGGDWCR